MRHRSVTRRRVPQLICSWLLIFVTLLVTAEAFAAAGDLTLFGPKRYERAQGKPWAFTDNFNGCANSGGQALLRVQNGSSMESSLSSALITLNGTKILVEADFKNQTALLERTITINPGSNTIATQLKSGGQKETPFLVVTVIGLGCDSTPPVISALQPIDGALLGTSRPDIFASYADNSGGAGIDTTSVRVGLDGNDITPFCTAGGASVSCTPSADLPEGVHNVALTVSDLLQNSASANWRFTTDTIAPRAVMTVPGSGQYLATRTVTVSGSIDDPAAIVTVNGLQATVSNSAFTSTLTLPEGQNTLTLIATDPAGNRSESAITITVDTSLPQVTVTAPIDGSYTNTPSITVSGTVGEPVSALTINGAAVDVPSTLTFTSTLALAEGLNSLTVTATDQAGNKGTSIVTVNLDTVKPLITVTAPVDGILTRNPLLTVSGKVSEPVTSLTINGAAVPVSSDSTFTFTFTLIEGPNTITLEAKDRAGNSGSATITAILDSTPPLAPALEGLPSPTNLSPVTVSGSAEPWSNVSLYNGTERVATIVTPQDGRFSFPEMVLHEGSNSFTVTALDPAGNESAPSAPVTVVLDTVAPVIGITAPLDKAILNTPVITLSGTIDDPAAAVTVNGLAALNSGGTWSLDNFTLQEGSNSLLVEAKDPAGNVGTAIVTVTLDTVQPAGTIVINGNAAVTGSGRLTLTLSATDGSGVKSMQFSNDGSSWSSAENFAATKEWDVTTGDGPKQVYVKYLDAAGNWSETFSAAIILDTIPPSVMSAPAGGLYNTPQSITLTASEAAAIYYTIDGTTPSLASAPYSQPVSIPATATLNFFARDPAGNSSPVKSESYAIDTVPPVAKITSHASGQYLNTPGITLDGTLDDPAATVTANGQPATVNGSTFTSTLTLTEGPNTLTVVATDPAGNSGTDSIVLNLDTISPQLAISTLSDGAFTNSETLNISGTVTDAGGLDKLMLNGAVVPVNADGSYSHALILQAGANAITVEAIDKAANKSSNVRTINLDQTAPQLTITAPADNSKTGIRLIEITGTVDEQVSSLTVNGAVVPLTSTSASTWTFTATVIPEYGYNTIEIIARDRAGNSSSQKRTVIFDDKKPSVTITEPAQDIRTKNSSLLLRGTATDADNLTAVTVTVTKDSETFSPPVVNGAFEQQLSFNSEKSYAIVITAKDEVGNETSVQRNVIYDITPPAITVNPFETPVNQSSQIISGSREAGVIVTVTSATATIGAVTYPTDTTWEATVTGLSADNNDIIVTTADLAGNQGNTATQIIYDTTPPVITITAPLADAFIKTPQITVTGSVSEPVASVTVNGVTATISSSATFTCTLTLAEGANTLNVTAIDKAGNSGTASVPVTLDTTPPVITITAPTADAFLKTPQITVTGSVNEPVTSVTVNGVTATISSSSTSTFTCTLTLAEGANTLNVTAIDKAGNSDTASVPVNLDTISPLVTITTPATGLLTKTAQITVSGTVSEPLSSLTLNGAAVAVSSTSTSTWSFASTFTLAEGANTLSVVAVDRAGNSGSAAVTVNLDSTSPALPVLTSQKTPTNVASVTISGTAEASSTVKISAAGALLGTVTADIQGNFTLPDVTLVEGNNSYSAVATDAAGNESAPSAPLNIVLDTIKPVITISAPQAGVVINTAEVQISGTVDEPLASLTVNGQQLTVNGLTFTSNLSLAAGQNSALIIATDPAGNSATTTLTIQRDSTPPVVVITAPQTGLLTNNSAVQVSGSVDDSDALLTVNGQPITVNGSTFNFTYTLSDGDNTIIVEATDKAGNKGTATTIVTLDAILPTLAIIAPAEAVAGANVAISLSASDNRVLTLVELKADGVPIWSGGNLPSLAEAISYRLSPALNAGAVVTLQAKGRDAAGNEGTAAATILITQAAMGPGYVQGKVLDDSRGLKLEGATVAITDAKGVIHELTTALDGGYFLETPAGSLLVKAAKPGFTTVERTLAVIPEKNITVLDARLTKIDETRNLIDANGGTAKGSPFIIHNSSFIIELAVPAGALASSSDLRLTPISNQGLAGLLPLGWSPLAVVDIRLLDPAAGTQLPTILASPATVKLPIPTGLVFDPAAPPILARYDETARQWLAVGTVSIDTASPLQPSALSPILSVGQYALVLPDPVTGEILQPSAFNLQPGSPLLPSALSPQPDFSQITATGKVVPQASPPSTGLKAAGEVVLTANEGATPTFTSGLTLSGRITENFDLKSGDKIESPVYSQDLVLYRTPCATNIGAGAVSAIGSAASLRTTFPVSPSKDYTIGDLLLGKVGIEIIKPDTSETGVMVGPDGGRLVDSDGNILAIPQGALALTTPVSTKTAAAAAGAVGSDFTLIRAVEVNLTRQTLAQNATLSIPAPAGLDSSLPLIVAKQIDVKGVAKLKLIAMARQSGTLITSESLPQQLNNSTTQLNSSGVYYFLQAKGQLGFITGTVSDAGNAPFTGALVKSDTGSLVDLSTTAGKYLLAAPLAPFTATATDLYKGDEISAPGAITAANQAVTVNLQILMIQPTVTAIIPANGAINIQPTEPVTVTFSKPMDKDSITSTTLTLTNSANSETVPGTLTFSIDNRTVTFYPADAFKQETGYAITVAASIKDLQGYSLGQDTISSFTVRKTTPPALPPAGSISGTFPDADGFITVTATQGSAEPGNTVLLINDTTGEIQSVTPASNGSFTGKVRGQLGDEIKVVLMDYSGNQTVISYLTFKNTDGSYLVTAKGGKVEGEGGSILDIPEGALVGPTIVKIIPVAEVNLPHPLPGPGRYLGAVNLDSGGISFQKKVDISLPLPAGFDPATPVFLTKPGEIVNPDGTVEKVYEIIDSTKVENGRITTACWPFDGIMAAGTYAFTAFPELVVGIVSGYTYQDMNEQPGYQALPDGVTDNPVTVGSTVTYQYDRPVRGAVVRSAQSWNYVSYSRNNGFYSAFTHYYNNIGIAGCRDYQMVAIHPLTMQRVTINGNACAPPYNIEKLNFKLADKGTFPPDRDPPLIAIKAAKVAGQGPEADFTNGVATVGTELSITITARDKTMGTATLSVELSSEAYSNIRTTPLSLGSPTVKTVGDMQEYTYPPIFTQDFAGRSNQILKPIETGLFRLIVDAKDAAGNLSSNYLDIRAVRPGEQAASIDGPPSITTVIPERDASAVPIDTPVTVFFSEAVKGVSDANFTLTDVTTNKSVPATVSTDTYKGLMKGLLVPKGNLAYGHLYRVDILAGIKDTTDNSLEPSNWQFTTKTPEAFDLNGSSFAARDIDYYNDTATGNVYACVAAGTEGWRIVDVTKPEKMSLVWPPADYKFPGFDYRNLAVDQQNSLLAMTDNFNLGNPDYHYGYIRFYSLADPKAPVVVGREKLAEAMSGIPGRISLLNGYAYVCTVGVGIQVVDIKAAMERQTGGGASDGSTIVGGFDTNSPVYFGSPMFFVPYRANAAAMTTTNGQFLTLDLSFPMIPTLVKAYQPEDSYSSATPKPALRFGAMAATADFAYRDSIGLLRMMDLAVAGIPAGGVRLVDLTDTANPRVIAPVRNLDAANSIATLIARDITINATLGLAVATALDGVYVIDIRNPNDPRVLNRITELPSGETNPAGSPVMIRLDGSQALIERDGTVYLANPSKGVKAIDLGAGEKISCNPNRPCD